MRERLISTDLSERFVGLDVLRGFALYGVLLTNASVTARPLLDALLPPIRLVDEHVVTDNDLVELIAWGLFDGLLITKFVTLFSLLFGMGLVLQNERAAAKDLPFARLYRRHLGILAIFGLLHGCLLFEGDILLVYALVGALLFFFRNQSPRFLVMVSLALFFLGVCMSLCWALFDFESLDNTNTNSVTLGKAFEERRHPATPLDVLKKRPLDYFGWLLLSSLISFNVRVVAFFFLGAAIMKRGWVLSRFRAEQAKVALIGVGIGLSIESLGIYLVTCFHSDVTLRLSIAVCDEIGSVFLSLGYAGGILWLVHTGTLPWLASGLAAVGRTALSNYLIQSVVMNVVFMDFLLGYYSRLTRIEVFVWFSAVFVCQIIASLVWLRRYKVGPVEWLWRRLTYSGIS